MKPSIHLKGLTIAPVAVEAMVSFYNAVFAANLTPFAAMGSTLYRGELAGLRLLFCPNDLLQIKAEKNRQQLSFAVSDIEQVVKTAVLHNGTLIDPITETPNGYVAGIADPDGNSIELRQGAAT